MKLYTLLIVIFKIFWVCFINRQVNQCFACKHDIQSNANNNISTQQHTKTIQKEFYSSNKSGYSKNKNNNYIDPVCINTNTENQIVLISPRDCQKYFLLSSYNSCYPKSHIQLKNDMFNIWYGVDKYSKNKYSQKISFTQLGIQDLLSNKTAVLGYGVRYTYGDQYMIGYNAILQSKIFSTEHQPYVINFGLEYWYKNLMIKLNSYFNITKFIQFNQILIDPILQYPKIGYQVCAQTKLPYLLACSGQIKWESFFYKNIENKKIFEKINYYKQYLSLAINYQPIPILGCSINKTLAHNKYNNILFKITLDYQFNVPILQQIQYTQYNNKSTISQNIDSIVEPFVAIPVNIYDTVISSLESTHEITGYPGEIKIFKIDSDNQSYPILDTRLLQHYGGKIVHLKNNFYAIQLPEQTLTKKNKIYFTYSIKNATNENYKNYKILVSITNFQLKYTSPNIITNHSSSSIIIKNENNDDITCTKNIQTNTCTPTFQDTVINKQAANNAQELNVDNQQDVNFPTPPPFPLLESIYTKQDDVSYTTSDISMISSTEFQYFQNIHDASSNSVPSNSMGETSYPLSSSTLKLEDKTDDDLLARLAIHKKHKFASIETPDYINKLEQSIINRKKDKCVSDIEQTFRKLFKSVSLSSIDESIVTDNNSNNSFE